MASAEFILPQSRVEDTLGIMFNPVDNTDPSNPVYDPALELIRQSAIEYGELFFNGNILDRTAVPMNAYFDGTGPYFNLQDSVEKVNLRRLPFEQVADPIDNNADHVTRGWFTGVEEFVYPGPPQKRVAGVNNVELDVLGYDTDSVPLYAFKYTGSTTRPATDCVLFVNTGISEVDYNRYMTMKFKNGLFRCCEAIKDNRIRSSVRHATPKDLEYAAMLFQHKQPITRY